ncbi:MAG: cytochrome bc complex cytochrome b subunit [Thermoanaerobaculia bacterium]
MPTRFQAATAFLSERLPLEKMSVRSLITTKMVPVHRMSWAYYLGGLTLFLFMVQMVTGLMLLFYYEPTVSDAHASVERITEHVVGGGLVRNLHTWAASAMILMVLAHMITTFAMKAFDKPREITWLSGVTLLLLAFGFGFTGYLLPWHQIAVNATKVGLQSIEDVGQYLPTAIATWPTRLRELIQGEPAVGQATLSRFYAIHVVVLPLVFLGLVGLHLLSVQLHGMSRGVDRPTDRTERFFPFFILKDFWVWGVAFLAIFTLALTLPFESFFQYPLFEAYNAMGSTPDGIKPEWYFYFVYYPLELLPFWVVGLLMNGAIVTLFVSPWIFKGTKRRTLQTLAVIATTYLVVMTLFGGQIYSVFRGGK